MLLLVLVFQLISFMTQFFADPDFVNVGIGDDLTIKEIAMMVKEVTGYEGELVFDTSKPDGTPRKLMNVDRINALGWKAAIDLKAGISSTYEDFKAKYEQYTSKKH